MKRPESVAPDDWKFAGVFSAGSRAVGASVIGQAVIVGNYTVPFGWRRLGQSSSDVAVWIDFDGDPSGSKLPIPRLHNQAGILSVWKEELEELQAAHPDGKQAVALKFGTAMVAGVLRKRRQFSVDPSNRSLLQIALGIGHDAIEASPGLYLPSTGYFVGAESTNAVARVPKSQLPYWLTRV